MIVVNMCWCGYFDRGTHKGEGKKEKPDLSRRCVCRMESFVLFNYDLSHQTLRKIFNRTEKDQDKQKNVPEATWAEP